MSRSQAPIQVVRGFCMGAADVVPGVSGGTIALVLGIYTDLIDQVRQGARALGELVRGRPAGFVRAVRAVDWWFMLPLLGGIGLAVLSLASLLSDLLHDEPIKMAGLFFGLVVGSVATTVGEVDRWDRRHLSIAGAVAVAAFFGLGLGSGAVTDPALAFVFIGGSIAICAMILPGISGSFLLLMLGLYQAVLDAVDERELVFIAVFGAGAVIGLALFSSLLSWSLANYHQAMLAGLIGLLVGSLRVLWPWPNGTGTEESTDGTALALPAGDVGWPIALAVIGAVAVVVLVRIAGVGRAEEPVSTPA